MTKSKLEIIGVKKPQYQFIDLFLSKIRKKLCNEILPSFKMKHKTPEQLNLVTFQPRIELV